jgi:hypothetical protein
MWNGTNKAFESNMQKHTEITQQRQGTHSAPPVKWQKEYISKLEVRQSQLLADGLTKCTIQGKMQQEWEGDHGSRF